MQLRRADTALADDSEAADTTYNDKYVVVYDFGNVDTQTAIGELSTLVQDLHSTGLNTEVRKGYDQTLLVFVQAPRDLLGNTVYKSRVKDWLYGITKEHPGGPHSSVASAEYEAEDVLSVYHLVHWRKDSSGAGITPEHGQWSNVTSIFPLHNNAANRALLARLSTRVFLSIEDMDSIRDILGTKIAFYFAFLQTYFISLAFPSVAGIFAWAFLPKYSLFFAMVIGVWCTVFLEYWKIQQLDLAIRWGVRGVDRIKDNRPQFRFDTQTVDKAGRIRHHFPRWKRIVRQMAVVPFLLVSTLLLGLLIALVFVVETFISEAYEGPYRFYLRYLPTVLLAVFLPYATNMLESIATAMTEYENHRTADHHEMALTQKVFILNAITNYLPILLTAFLYVPFGDRILPVFQGFIDSLLGGKGGVRAPFLPDADRLRNEVIALTLTGQIFNAFEELAWPWLKVQAKEWWRDRQAERSRWHEVSTHQPFHDNPFEARFLRRARNQASRPAYNVQEDIAEMVFQFGYLALFSPVWPLLPIGFVVNNWIELRSDFLKICVDHQRPTPARSDGIGPWVASLECLTWLGSISSAAIVHLFGSTSILVNRFGLSPWASLPMTILVSEHIFMTFRAAVRFALSRIGSEQTRKENAEQYAQRKQHLDELEAHDAEKNHLGAIAMERRRTVRLNAADLFWLSQVEEGASEQAGISIIKAVKNAAEENKVTGKGKSE